MGNLKIAYTNKVDASTATLSSTSAAAQFPATNVRRRWRSQGWRSGSGSSSSGGNFVIDATNNTITFYENSVSTTLTATLTTGTYSAASLATEIETQLEAAGANTYTVTYDLINFKFIIDLDTGTNFGITGGNAGTALFYDTYSWLGWVTTWTAPDIRIHTYEEIQIDCAVQENFDFFAFFGHNIQSGATVQIMISNDNFATGNTWSMLRGADNLYAYFLSATAGWTNLKVRITDRDNPDGYVTIGRLWFGEWNFIPTWGRSPKYNWKPKDKSTILESEGGQISTIQNPHTEEIPYDLQSIDEAGMKALYDSRGESLELVLLEKKISTSSSIYTDPEDYLKYGRMREFRLKHRAGESWSGSFNLIKEL